MKNSSISWTHHTFNPWIGCTKVSPGCANCYAEVDRSTCFLGVKWGRGAPRHRTKTCGDPLAHDRAAKRAGEIHRLFCASLADVFDPEVPMQWRSDLYDLIRKTRNLDWLLLTKRPSEINSLGVPPDKVWLGTSVEDQYRADERIPELLKIPAAIHFLSVEPLLEPVDLGGLHGIDWVIVGGESGPRLRPMKIEWARSLRDQCRAAGIAFFMKQLGGYPDKQESLDQFPEDLRIREFPRGAK